MTTTPSMEINANVPRMDIDLYSSELIADPWPALKQIREAGPVVWNERGYWMTARDRICRQILNHPEAMGQEGMVSAFFGKEAFISIDNKAEHNALRNVWMPAFRRDAVDRLAPFVREVTGRLLDRLEGDLRQHKAVDIADGLCRPLPTYVISHMMGVEDKMVPEVVKWSDYMGDATLSGFPIDYHNDPHWLAGERAKAEFAEYVIGQIRLRREKPGDELISQIVHSEVGSTLSEHALMLNLRQLLFAGNETTAKWLGHIIAMFGRRPDIRREVSANRALLPAAMDEIMRYEGVTQVLPRGVSAAGAMLAGVALPPNSEILMLLGGANRDPDRYPDPDRLDIHRDAKGNLGFGFGLHNCLGMALAKMEAFEVASMLLDRFPDFEIVEPVKYGGFSLRGPTALWLKL